MFKIKLMLVCLLIGVFANSYSQVNVKLGLEAGVAVSNSNITPEFLTDSRTGMIFGGNIDLTFSRNLALISGIRYVQKGYSFVSTVNNARVDVTNSVDYLQFPVLLKYRFPLTEINPYLIGGPIVGVKLAAEQEVTRNNSTTRSDIDGLIESGELSLMVGGGIDFRLTSGNEIFLQMGYEFGLTDIDKVNTSVEVKPYLFQLTGGIKFDL